MQARLLTGLCLVLIVSTAVADDDARAWLERMNHALATRNYDGTFFQFRNGKVETLRIIHRVADGKVSERLVSLDGSGREIIRNDEELTCYLPDQKRVLVETRQERGALLGTLPAFDTALSDNYRLEMLPRARLLGRTAQVIAVNPKDAYRFGYRLWIDEGTALPLKTQICDEKGNVIEQVLFANITLPESIPKSAVETQVNSEGLQWEKQPSPKQGVTAFAGLSRAIKAPPGFKRTATNSQMMEGSTSPVAHLVYSDGLASVSVFIEVKSPRSEPMNGLSRVGSANTFSTMVRGHQVTVVGEVPAQTVQFIAGSIKPEVDAASASAERSR